MQEPTNARRGTLQRLRAVCVLSLLSLLAMSSVAQAQTEVVGLTGELLVSFPDAQASGTCNPSGNSTYTFTVSGTATGPYPGTFTESGTVTIGPQTEEFVPGQFRGQLVSFEAEFTILSPVGTVTGHKTLVLDQPSPVNIGVCASGGIGAQVIANRLTYTATITTPQGTFRDEGTSFANFNLCTRPAQECGITSSPNFREGFASTGLVPVDSGAEVVVVTPPTAINEVGTQHTVTATATTAAGGPAEGVTVLFTVAGASDVDGSCTTDAQGQCTFTYTGPQLPGADLITACADNDESGAADTGESCGTATKIWILPVLVGTPGQVTGGGWITSTGRRVSFGFNAKSDGDTIRANCNVIDHATKTQIKCLTVDVLVVAGTHATFTGQATVDGVVTNYRIDVDDLGEPGVLDTFKIQTDSGYTAAGSLEGGNIQIHR